MKLVLHQFRKDIRQFRLHLLIWSGLLLLDLAVNLGWIGRVVYSTARGFDCASNIWTTILPGLIWALVGLLPSLVILADSPARRDGFLATRPLPKWDLCAAKILFVLALIVAPWVLQECVHLAGKGTPAWVVERGTFERLLFTLPVAFSCAAFAALWPDPARWARAVGILLATYIVVGVATSLLIHYFHFSSLDFGSDKSHGLLNWYGLAAALIGLAVWHSRAPRTPAVRWGVFFVVLIGTQWVVARLPWDFFPLKPADPSLAASVLAQSGWEIPTRNIEFQKTTGSDGPDDTQYDVKLIPKIRPLSGGVVLEWAGKDARFSRVAGGEIPGDWNVLYPALFDNNAWGDYFPQTDLAAWAPEFPEDVLFHTTTEQDYPADINLGALGESVEKMEQTDSLTLQASLQARVFQWKKIADFPMTPGATSTDEFGSWKFVAAKLDHPKTREIFLERSQISLITAPDSRCSSVENGPLARMAWMIYDPVHQVVSTPDQRYFSDADRGTQTALPQYFIRLSFYNGQLTKADADHCRVVVFEKTWAGSVPEAWKSGDFTLADKLRTTEPVAQGFHQAMGNAEFRRRAAALAVPAPDAPRREVARYLLDFLELVNAHHAALRTNDSLTKQLAKFVPAHLDLLIDGLPAMNRPAYETTLNAITLGATDAQKPPIIAALQKDPQLAEVLLARHWVEDARPELEQLARSPKWLPVSAMRALVQLHDEQTYPRLLKDFDESPTVAEDGILRQVPGMTPKLDEIIARHWRTDSLVWEDPGVLMVSDIFELAMRTGDRSALLRLYQVLDDPDFDQSNNQLLQFARPLRRSVQAPGVSMKGRGDVLLAWMRQHQPDDFVFSPALRKFVLK